jgi:hypothetical protein
MSPMRRTRATSLLATLTVVLASAAVLVGATAQAKGGSGSEARVKGVCGEGGRSELRLRAKDGAIELEFEVKRRARERWRVVIVQEHRVVLRLTVRSGSGGSMRVRRSLTDLPGADRVMVRASGPRGVTCEASALLGG